MAGRDGEGSANCRTWAAPWAGDTAIQNVLFPQEIRVAQRRTTAVREGEGMG